MLAGQEALNISSASSDSDDQMVLDLVAQERNFVHPDAAAFSLQFFLLLCTACFLLCELL